MKELLKLIAPGIRTLGFKGSGQSFRREEGDFVFIINFQGSRTGEYFYVNLGAQPAFIPAEGHADLKSLKEYECVLRRRVGTKWSWSMSEKGVAEMLAEIDRVSSEFFGHAQTLRQAFNHDSAAGLLSKFSSGTTKAHAALNLALGARNLGLLEVSQELATYGLSICDEQAVMLIKDLGKVVEECRATKL